MISHEFKCIFIHQRKCAGMSVISSFGLTPDDADWHFMNNGALDPDRAIAPADYVTFSVVRNPWDRFVSAWKYLESTKHRPIWDVLTDLPHEGADHRHITMPQHALLCDEDGCLIVDHVMRFETLQDDYHKICDLLGKPRMVLPRINIGEREHYSTYFDDETRAMVHALFRKDIELFGYSFQEA